MIRVVLVEDHQLVRQGIRALLERVSDIQIIGEAANGHEAVQLVQRLAPDVLVMDIVMPRLDGFQAIEQVRALGVITQVIVLSMYDDEILVRRAICSKARWPKNWCWPSGPPAAAKPTSARQSLAASWTSS